MTWTPQPPFGGATVNATVSTVNANFGSGNSSATLANSPNFNSGETSTETYETASLNGANIGTLPPSNNETT
jgi:hypothetical protein